MGCGQRIAPFLLYNNTSYYFLTDQGIVYHPTAGLCVSNSWSLMTAKAVVNAIPSGLG